MNGVGEQFGGQLASASSVVSILAHQTIWLQRPLIGCINVPGAWGAATDIRGHVNVRRRRRHISPFFATLGRLPFGDPAFAVVRRVWVGVRTANGEPRNCVPGRLHQDNNMSDRAEGVQQRSRSTTSPGCPRLNAAVLRIVKTLHYHARSSTHPQRCPG